MGVCADSPLQLRWLVEAFARVAASDFAVVTVLVIAGKACARLPWLLAAYGALDRLAFGGEPAEPLPLAEQVPHERCMASVSAAELAALDLDVVFAIGELDDTLLDGVARYGVWRFCFGADGAEPEALAGFHEVAGGEPLSCSGLRLRLAAGAAPRLAYESWGRTSPLSVARNRAQLLNKSAEFAYRALRELHRSGHDWLESCREVGPASPARQAPGNGRLLRDLAGIGGRILRRALVHASHIEQWFLAFRFDRPGQSSVPADLAGFTPIVPPKDRDWADPFVLQRNGRYYVFFEERPFAAGKGHISVIEIERSGRWSALTRVLERDYHLSYPFLLEHDGDLFMVPESAQNRTVEIYRCTDFPRRWRLERTLLEGVRCVDATLQPVADHWWMFANVAAGQSRAFDDELHLFHAERFLGDWRPHARNPVISDVRSARPAGRLYSREGVLYRPAQICVPRYGAGLAIHRVQRLTPHEYVETQVERIVPASRQPLLGIHTVNRAAGLTVVDAFTRRPRIGAPVGRAG